MTFWDWLEQNDGAAFVVLLLLVATVAGAFSGSCQVRIVDDCREDAEASK